MDALCLTYPQDIAVANALIGAKNTYDVYLTFDKSDTSASDRRLIVEVGSFSSAIFIAQSVPYMEENCSSGYIVPIIPNMYSPHGIICEYAGEKVITYVSGTPSGSNMDCSFSSSTTSVTFQGYIGTSSLFHGRLTGILAVLS